MKKRYIIIIFLFLVAGVVLLFKIGKQEDIDISPVERYQLKDKAENESSEKELETSFIWGGITYDFLAYEVLTAEELHQESKYPPQYFYLNALPDLNKTEEIRDTEAIKAECPALKDIWEDTTNKYSSEEVKKIYNDNIDIIEKHTQIVPYDRHYVFVKCKLTNTAKMSQQVYLNCLEVFVTDTEKEEFIFQTDTMDYFNKAVHTEGEDRLHSFGLYTFMPGEELECILGFEVRDKIENPEFYIGFHEVTLQDEGINPVFGENVIKLSNNIKLMDYEK